MSKDKNKSESSVMQKIVYILVIIGVSSVCYVGYKDKQEAEALFEIQQCD